MKRKMQGLRPVSPKDITPVMINGLPFDTGTLDPIKRNQELSGNSINRLEPFSDNPFSRSEVRPSSPRDAVPSLVPGPRVLKTYEIMSTPRQEPPPPQVSQGAKEDITVSEAIKDVKPIDRAPPLTEYIKKQTQSITRLARSARLADDLKSPPRKAESEGRGTLKYLKKPLNIIPGMNMRLSDQFDQELDQLDMLPEKKKREFSAELDLAFSEMVKRYPDMKINIPEKDGYLSSKARYFYICEKYVKVSASATGYRIWLVVYFLILELVATRVCHLAATGFTLFHIKKIDIYDKILLDLAEKYQEEGDSSWPPEVRLLIMSLIYLICIIILQTFGNYLPAGALTTVLEMVGKLGNIGPGHVGVEHGPFDIGNIIANVGSWGINNLNRMGQPAAGAAGTAGAGGVPAPQAPTGGANNPFTDPSANAAPYAPRFPD